jgi:hypothetical protein
MRLHSVLADDDLSAAELHAARLDGEVYDLGGAFCLIGELEGPAHRARAVLAGRSSRLIVELRTASWVWGVGRLPERPEFAVMPDARARLGPGEYASVREIVYAPEDVVDFGGARATSPLRTIIDLARHPDLFDPVLVRQLGQVAGATLPQAAALLSQRHGIPGKRLAQRRLPGALTPVERQPVDTRYTS